ncbi:unnamed protein product [Withania somnifera]
MSNGGELLQIEPVELQFPFELKKQISCSMQLTNKSDNYVAFKVKTTNPKKYCVRPNTGIVMPQSAGEVTVTMQAQKEAPPDMQCKDKFLLQSVVARPGATAKDITPEMFNKDSRNYVEDRKLKVVYVPPQLPSPVREGSEEGSSPRASVSENGAVNTSEFNNISSAYNEQQGSLSETKALISKLTEEKISVMQQNSKLQQELVRALTYNIFYDLLSPFLKNYVLITSTYRCIGSFT